MADSQKKNNVGGVLGAAIGLISVATPIVTTLLEKLPEKSTESKPDEERAIVPELYTKGFPLTLDQANEKLVSEGFKMIASKLSMNEADIKYKDCFDTQVVDSKPKSKEKTKPGTTVIVRYVTQDVITESQRLFSEMERHKMEKHNQKLVKRAEQKVQAKQMMVDVAEKTKNNVKKIFIRRDREETDYEQK